MRLSRVIEGIRTVRTAGNMDADIGGIVLDSRAVKPGYIFAAIPGFKQDGNEYVPPAVDAGAAAVITDRWHEGIAAAQVQVEDVRRALARSAANFYGNPSQALKTVGITGTNGKTTTSFMLRSILTSLRSDTTLIGGVEYVIGGRTYPAVRTTPESVDLQSMLARALEAGDTHAVLEVSSHGIDLFRAAYVDFDVAVFTNLTRDHLDLHGDMEEYFQVKRRLFLNAITDDPIDKGLPVAVVNTGSEYGTRLAGDVEAAGGRVVTFSAASVADVTAEDIVYSGWETAFELRTPDGAGRVTLKTPGSFNLANALAAAGAAHALGLPAAAIAAGLDGHRGAPGRFETVDVDTAYRIVIDYAHNVDGLARALETARSITPGRLILVFGCPGERDRDKRPTMGKLAGTSSDLALLTTDDCYGEPPEQILDEAEAGLVESGGEYQRIADRREAISRALSAAGPGDTVLIAGKGHETKQVMAAGPVPFNDRQVVLELLS